MPRRSSYAFVARSRNLDPQLQGYRIYGRIGLTLLGKSFQNEAPCWVSRNAVAGIVRMLTLHFCCCVRDLHDHCGSNMTGAFPVKAMLVVTLAILAAVLQYERCNYCSC